MPPASKAALSALIAAQAAALAARRPSCPGQLQAPRWQPAAHFVLRASTLGLGLAAQTMRLQLDEAPAGGWGGGAGQAAGTALRLLFGSLAPLMLLFSLAWPLRLRCAGWRRMPRCRCVPAVSRTAAARCWPRADSRR